ncbi:MAG: DUF4876 domain-containing protein, partial [Myxococcales bacterium]|nr:DUF4876 domain-containing protein [Myxococcales bacterium]
MHRILRNPSVVRVSTVMVAAPLITLLACSTNAPQQETDAIPDDASAVGDVSSADACDSECCGDVGCQTNVEPSRTPVLGDLLIEEIYYSGAPAQGGTDHYLSDQFIELVNTTDHVLDLSGVMIGDAYGAAGAINPGMSPDSFAATHPDEVVLSSVWRMPTGTILAPAGRLVIAQDGANHRPFSSVDLSGARFEAYVAGSGRDDDYLTVANLESVVFNGGFDWLITVFGPSVVVLQPGTTLGTQSGPLGELATAPIGSVLDAVEALMDGDSGDFKRLPSALDAGFAFVSDTYVGESLRRVQIDGRWQDTNDSSADFVVGEPDPGQASLSGHVFGEPHLEIGTGFQEFVGLSDGDSVELVAGFQGGWHVDTAVRLDGFGPDGVLLVYDAVDGEGERVSFETQALLAQTAVLPSDQGWVRLGDRVVFDIDDAAAAIGTTIVLRVTAQLDGQTWSDERSVIVVDD